MSSLLTSLLWGLDKPFPAKNSLRFSDYLPCISANLKARLISNLNGASLEEAILYVKSEKFDLVSWASDLHCGCDAAYRSIRTDRIFSEEDREAIKILGESSIPHSVIDLTDCPLTFRIKAKFEGINETPTLIAGSTKIKGLHEIMKCVSKLE